MGNKRIYFGREVSKYAEIAGGAIITITALFFVLMAVGLEITGSNDNCLGTPEDPCVSYGKICNLGPDNYDIYNPDQVKLDFSPTIEDHWMFFKDGRVKKEMLYNLGIDASTKGWRYENFTDATKPRKDRVYVHRFARYSCQEYMLVGLKENPNDIIKWGMGVKGEYLDPFWYGGENVTTILIELGSQVNISANISGVADVCVDIDHPDYGLNYTCGSPTANFLFNISYFRKTELNDSSTETNLSFNGPENQTIYVYAHQYDELNNLSINLTGFTYNGTYPSIKIYVNNTLSNTIGLLFTGELTQEEMNDGNLSSELFFDPAGEIHTVYVEIPKNAEVSSALANFSSYSQEMDYTGTTFSAAGGLTQDSIAYLNGFFWISDALNNQLNKYTIEGVNTGVALGIVSDQGTLGYNNTLWLIGGTTVREYWTNGTQKSSFSTDAANADPMGITEFNGSFYIGDGADQKYYRYFVNGTYVGVAFESATEGNIEPVGGTTNGTYIWITDNDVDEVYKYWINGTYTGDSFDTAGSSNTFPFGITNNDTYIWVTDGSDKKAYKYLMDGTPVDSFSMAIIGNSNPFGITNNDTFFWIVDITDDEVYKYFLNGKYISSFDTAASGNTNPSGITNNDTYIWVTDVVEDEVYKYWANGTYINSFDTATNNNNEPFGITNNNTFFWITDDEDDKVYKYLIDGTPVDSFSTSSSGNNDPVGITTNNTFLWVEDWVDDKVYKYLMDGTFTGDSFDVAGSGNDAARGVTNDGTYIWVTDFFNGDVYKYLINGTFTGEKFDTTGSGSVHGITTNNTYIWIVNQADDVLKESTGVPSIKYL